VAGEDKVVKRMSELLRAGAVMLDLACPLCNAPLFKLKSGEVVCPTHGPVRVVKTDSEAIEALSQSVLDRLEALATSRIGSLVDSIDRAPSVDEEGKLLDELERWLEVLERVKRLKSLTARSGK
jgi:UPF0148 protein